MQVLATIMTIFALALVETVIMMYQPRTKVGSIFYELLLIPASIILFIAVIIIAQTG